MSANAINLYDNVYGDFASSAEQAVRQETYGEDLGQSSWLTAREWLGVRRAARHRRRATRSWRWAAAPADPRCTWPPRETVG